MTGGKSSRVRKNVWFVAEPFVVVGLATPGTAMFSTAPKKYVLYARPCDRLVRLVGSATLERMSALSCRKQPRLADWEVRRSSTALNADDPDVSKVWSPAFCWTSTWTNAAVLARS